MHHEIEIKLVNQTSAIPPNPMPEMQVGDTVRYFSSAGDVTITFPLHSPFRADDTAMTEVSTPGAPFPALVRAGTFACGCVITLPNQQKVGWPMAGATSGGEHVVK
jgi:hypothetical protein